MTGRAATIERLAAWWPWPVDGDPFTGEWDRARGYARGQGRVCWVDGVVLG